MDQDQFSEEEKFSDDQEENLRMQNDFLKMKMMAESGAFFGGEGGLPPEIENLFLKNVMEFEKMNADSKPIKIFDFLNKPVFEDEKDLDEEKFKIEFKRLEALLEENSINISFTRERDDRFKYDFITKEIIEHETTFIPVNGMTTYLSYEEFHPDHEAEITEITNQFLQDFFERTLNVDTDYINDQIIEPDGNILSREQLINRFHSLYEAATEFENTSFQLENLEFELKEPGKEPSAMGFSEGWIRYDMIFSDGSRNKIDGPFKIYFAREFDYWSICFFYLAGYNLQLKEE
jgi:hypothetical protein